MNNNKNIIFVFIVVFLLFIIALFNFFINPYNIFRNKNQNFYLLDVPGDILYTYLKSFEDRKSNTVIIGSSDACNLFGPHILIKDKVEFLTHDGGTLKEFYNMLQAYLDLHPETKNIIFVVNYMQILYYEEMEIPEYRNIFYDKHTIIRLLFSYATTKESIKKIKEHIGNIKKNKKESPHKRLCYPNHMIKYYPKKNCALMLDKIEEGNLIYFDKIINLLEKRQIKYQIVIPPYNAAFLAVIKNNNLYQSKVENIKKFLCDKTDFIYDFSFVNKYTSTSLLENNSIYYDYIHINTLFGIKIYKIFFDKDYADNQLYMKLNKDNYDDIIKKQNQLIDDYIQKNKDYVQRYIELAHHPIMTNKPFVIPLVEISDLNQDWKNEIEYAKKKNSLYNPEND